MKNNESIERLPCKMTDQEKVETAERMSSTLKHIDTLECAFITVKEQHKTAMETYDSEIRSLSQELRTGEIYRDVKCLTQPDWVKREMTTTRTDTGEIIRTRPITAEEQQMHLFPDGVPDENPNAPEETPPAAVPDGQADTASDGKIADAGNNKVTKKNRFRRKSALK